MSTVLRMVSVSALALVWTMGSAHADSRGEYGEKPKSRGFIEATGGYGFQFGVQDYVPDGAADQFRHPLTTGWTLGATAGFQLSRNISLIVGYEYANVSSREGDIDNVLDRVEGSVTYHTAVVGIRLWKRLGGGKLALEFAAGILLPFETELEFEYGPALAAIPNSPITGSGRRISEYNMGYGAHGQIGYYWRLNGPLYLGLAVKVHSFQSNNNGQSIVLENFVTDLTAPAAVNTELRFDDNGGMRPTTYSIQAVRAYLSIGVRF